VSPEELQRATDELARLMLDAITLPKPPAIPADYDSVDSLQELYAVIQSLRQFLSAAANGDLSQPVGFRGYLAGTLKTLQANLRHISWQTKMVASGDFTQRAQFMGEFSQSFNAMVVQLDETLKELTRREHELREANEALGLLATSDPLTGLYNRRHFFELAQAEIERALRYSRPLSLVMFDIDFFKEVNDTYGHTAGDTVLEMVARVAQGALRTNDISARYGGEEFVVLLPETNATVAATAAEKLRSLIEKTGVQNGEHEIRVTVSFGVTDHLQRSSTALLEKRALQLIDQADEALYASKHAGRNRVTMFQPPEPERKDPNATASLD